jgi:hypothetical protein
VTDGKNEHSMSSVMLHPALADYLKEWRRQTAHAKESDWVFASKKCSGRIPRCASIAARDYLRPAAVDAGVLPKDDTSTRFGWHSLRHSLAEFFADNGVDPAVTMKTLRHKKLSTTLEIYTHRVQNSQIAAQGKFLQAIKVATEGNPVTITGAETGAAFRLNRRKSLKGNGRHEETRTPDLYRVKRLT